MVDVRDQFSSTALIIGAGAHVPYGFPTGMGLTEEIKKLMAVGKVVVLPEYSDPDHPKFDKFEICKLLLETGIIQKNNHGANGNELAAGRALDEFLLAFGGAQVYSIDRFLAKRNPDDPKDKQFIEIGKLLIIYFIKKYEEHVPIGFHGVDWIQYIFDQFFISKNMLQQFIQAPPLIVTFNYDNFLEKSFFYHMVNQHGLSKNQALESVKRMGILHMYGDIGSLYDEQGMGRRSYGETIKNIFVIGEERTKEHVQKIQESLLDNLRQSIEKVYFLGFGFDPLNIKALFGKSGTSSKDSFPNVKFVTTTKNLQVWERREVQKMMPVKIDFKEGDCDCLSLLREREPIFKPSAGPANLPGISR